jgi:hypothetical protein
MLFFGFLRGCLRFAGLVMTEMPNISFYTTRTWAFLYDGTKSVIDHYVSRAAAYIGKRSYQVACHMLVNAQIKLASAKQLSHRCIRQCPFLYFDPMQDLQIVDSTHKLQEHDPGSADVSDLRLGAVAEIWLAGRTVIDFPSLFGILTRPRGRR